MEAQIAANNRKTWGLFTVFFAIVGAISYFAGIYAGDYSITIMALVFATGYALWSYYSSSKLALSINGAKEVDVKSAPRLYRTVENLTIATGMPMPKVYLIDDPAPNAFATGRDPEHAVVAATTGLVNMMTKPELEGVMAHELGHVRNRDIRVSMIAFALVAVIGLISDFVMRSFFWGGLGGRDNDRGGSSPFVIGAIIIAAILGPIAAKLIQLAISRRREFMADATGVQTTRYPDGLASALEKIGAHGSSMKRQNTSTAHLFFANPLKKNAFTKLFSTHPPIEDRIKVLKGIESVGF